MGRWSLLQFQKHLTNFMRRFVAKPKPTKETSSMSSTMDEV